MHEIDGRRSSASFGPGVRLDRFVVADGIDMWIAEGHDTHGWRAGVSTDRLEIDAQLEGQSTRRTQRGSRAMRRGDLHRLNPGETYDLTYGGRGPFLGMGITVDPALFGPPEPGRDLRAPDPTARAPELCDLFELVYRLRRANAPLPRAEIVATVTGHVARSCDLAPADPVSRARQLLEEHFDCELYLAHVAAEVGLTEVQLIRRFARRYGATPIRYRSQVRLTRAGRLAWSDPKLPTAAIAARSGFHHLAYFHRSYRAYFGTTPAIHRASPPAR